MVRVLVIFSSSEIGGAEKSITRFVAENRNKEITYTCASFSRRGPWSNWAEQLKIYPKHFDNSLFKLAHAILTEDYKIVYVMGFRLSIFLRFFKIFKNSLKIIQGVRWNPSSNSSLDFVFRKFETVFGWLIDGYIVNSLATKNSLQRLKCKNIKLIYNGIDNIPKNRKPSDYKKIITIANLSKRKGYENYIKVIKNILSVNKDLEFVFIGKDFLNGKIQNLIKKESLEKNIIYLGFQEDVSKYLSESALFVLPSLYGEGCPTSILEAGSYSIPVISYKIDGLPEVIKNYENGILIEPYDEPGFKTAILELMENMELLDYMGARGREIVIDRFTLRQTLSKHNHFFLNL